MPAAAHASSKLYRQFLVHELRPGAFAAQRARIDAATRGEAFYRGEVAAAIAGHFVDIREWR